MWNWFLKRKERYIVKKIKWYDKLEIIIKNLNLSNLIK